MTALRALLVAVFGGFIGAAPAAPVFLAAETTGGRGQVADAHAHSQKRDGAPHRPESAERPAAAAPPGVDGLGHPAPSPAAGAADIVRHRGPAPRDPRGVAPPPERHHAPAAAAAAVRAGLLGLPPPRAR